VRRLEFLAPASKVLLQCLATQGLRQGEEIGVPEVIIAMRRRGIPIGTTLAAVEECRAGGWLTRRSTPDQPDCIAFTSPVTSALQSLQAV